MDASNNQLQTIVKRIETLEADKAAITSDIKDVYTEAKSVGFDSAIIKKIVAMRKKSDDDRKREEQMIKNYMQSLGMLADTPLGQAAMKNMSF